MEIILEEGEKVCIRFRDTFREPIDVAYTRKGIFIYAPELDARGRDEYVYEVIFPQHKTDKPDCDCENENEVLK